MRPQHDPEARQRDRDLHEAVFDRHSRERGEHWNGDADGQDGGEGCGREINDEDGAVERELEEGIFLQARRAEIEPVHRQHSDAQGLARMVDQPAIQSCQESAFPTCSSIRQAQHHKSQRRKHQRERHERVSHEHDRLAAAEPELVERVLRQQQQRRRGVHHIDRMLVGNLPPDREQPARKQIGIEDHREQDRQRQACGRGRDQADLLPAR
ncbi:hypothetical protein [Bradyrhizobium sp. B117]|uniref:hypothetical protein n=1 Tax=Bradyrhizobium sp. B117 TaxID=3140246 RepID=UPI003183DA20